MSFKNSCFFNQFFFDNIAMKFPFSVTNKKYASKMDTEKTNRRNSLSSALEIEPQTIKDIYSISHQENCSSSLTSGDSVGPPDQGFNMSTPSDLWSEEGKIHDIIENIDKEGKLFHSIKRSSLDHSISWEDSGFNSCTSDDRDDLSILDRLSFDSTSLGDDDDENSNVLRQIPFKYRPRSYSLDSEASDASDSLYQHTKSSISTYSDLEKNMVLWRDNNVKVFNEDNILSVKKSEVNKIKGKTESIRHATHKQDCKIHGVKPDARVKRQLIKDSNNNSSSSIIKNLSTNKKHSSPCVNNTFQEYGLISFLFCIFYTLVLGFIVGICGILLQVIKMFLSKADLQDLMESVHSHHDENQLKLREKEKAIAAGKRRLPNK